MNERGALLYRVQAYQRYNGSADDPVGELEVGVPLVHSALEPVEGLTATQVGGSSPLCVCV